MLLIKPKRESRKNFSGKWNERECAEIERYVSNTSRDNGSTSIDDVRSAYIYIFLTEHGSGAHDNANS